MASTPRQLADRAPRLARLVAPSGPLKQDAFAAGLEAMTALDIAHTHEPSIRAPGAYLAGPDAERAQRLVDAVTFAGSHRGAAVWMARGGYGAIRTLDALDDGFFDQTTPAPLWGFSDGTALLAAWDRAGWPCWHAPPVTQLPRLDVESRARLRAAWHADHVAPFEGLLGLADGQATGPLAGGNLCVLASLIGTPMVADLRGRVVVLEDTGEGAYKVDRLFTQLRLSGALDGIAGLIFGEFTGTHPNQVELIRVFVAEAARSLGVPVASELPVGHASANAALPFGAASGWVARLEVAGAEARLTFVRGDA